MGLHTGETFLALRAHRPVVGLPRGSREIALRGFTVATVTRRLDILAALSLTDNDDFSTTDIEDTRWQPQKWLGLYQTTTEKLQIPEGCCKGTVEVDCFAASMAPTEPREQLMQNQILGTSLRRTLCASSDPPYREDASFLWRHYHSWKLAGFPAPCPPDVLRESDKRVKTRLRNRCFFIAGEDGDQYMGIGSEHIREGDVVCTLLGGKTPCILRPKEDKWEFLGECYVDCIMYGEAMNRTEEEGFEYQDYTLI